MWQVPTIESHAMATLTAYVYYFKNKVLGEEVISEIIPGKLYIGNLAAAFDQQLLEAHGISHVLSITQFGKQACWFPHLFTYKYVTLQDSATENLCDVLDDCVAFINNVVNANQHSILVHCNQGRSRSVAATAAFLCQANNWTVDHALDFIRQRRAVAGPNAGFVAQLHQWREQQM